MAITNQYKRVPCKDIVIKREDRQRKIINTAGLKDSIAIRGVLQPIIVHRDLTLVAGERRLTASLELGLPDIPCRFFEELDAFEAQVIELEENVKRSDLTWQDTTRAVVTLHEAYKQKDPAWTQGKTAQLLSMESSAVGRYLRVGEEISNPRILSMQSFETAFNHCKRQDERRAGDAVSEIMQVTQKVLPPTTASLAPQPKTSSEGDQPELTLAPTTPAAGPPPPPILLTSFQDWVQSYEGAPFNFLHCDFPYGIDVFGGTMGDASKGDAYVDTPDVYFALVDALADNLDKVLSISAHVMFWFSMEHHKATLEAFASRLPDIVWQKHPLIWMKSDNVGIMPDPKRAPRRVYETCLLGTRGDRPLVKPVSNAYSCPTNREHHPSTKPEPMLRHFMQMFVDNGTRMLDPTCGGGSALRAATAMGAESVLGLEQDPEHHANASRAWNTFSTLRKMT